MKAWAYGIVMAAAICSATGLHYQKYEDKSSALDSVNAALQDFKPFFKPGVAIGTEVVGDVKDAGTINSWVRYCLAPAQVRMFLDKPCDTVLYIAAKGEILPDPSSKQIIWQKESADRTYLLVRKQSAIYEK